jgi:integrase
MVCGTALRQLLLSLALVFYTIQKILGHASSQNIQLDAHLADGREMREASMAAVTMLANTDR